MQFKSLNGYLRMIQDLPNKKILSKKEVKEV